MKRVDHYRRLFGTTLSFVVFGIAGLIIGLVLLPLMFVFIRDRESRKSRARMLIGRAFGAFVRMMKKLGVIDYRIDGREHVHRDPHQLIIANHPTLIDVVLLISLFPQANCVIKGAVTRNPFMRSVAAAADYISNSEPENLLASCTAYLKSGGSLLLFPEGTRTRRGRAIEFKPGAATVAIRADVDILPIAIHCEPLVLDKDLPWYYVPAERPLFTIRILPPVSIPALVPTGEPERKVRNEFNRTLLEIVRRELDDMA